MLYRKHPLGMTAKKNDRLGAATKNWGEIKALYEKAGERHTFSQDVGKTAERLLEPLKRISSHGNPRRRQCPWHRSPCCGWNFTRWTGASIGTPKARPLRKTHISPVLSTTAGQGAFTAPSKIVSYFPKRHKGLAMAFSYQEAIGE